MVLVLGHHGPRPRASWSSSSGIMFLVLGHRGLPRTLWSSGIVVVLEHCGPHPQSIVVILLEASCSSSSKQRGPRPRSSVVLVLKYRRRGPRLHP
ncbi:hypothetical protein BDZ89DRAFT_1077035 [Hymenopellis radicata]|nr:hypothetical protein BDZ89DRAFT_1077035 [Hymenopellis radicata]